MVLDDRLIQGIDRESIETVLRPKASGALHLEQIAGRLALDYLLLFSSATTLFGNPGQFNYVAGNAYVEGIATAPAREGPPCARRRLGRASRMPAISPGTSKPMPA